jgi:plastocyanin
VIVLAVGAATTASAVMPALAADQTIVAASDDTLFTPKTVTVNVGDTVTFSHKAGVFPHNVRFEDQASGNPAAPSTGAWTTSRKFDATGTFRFYCEQHGGPGGFGMSGKVIVVASGAPVPDTTRPVITSPKPTATSFAKSRPVKISLKLSEAATINGTILRRSASGTLRFFGLISKSAHSGANTIDVTRTKAGRRLTPGSYELTFTAVDKARNRSNARTVRWKVRTR